MASIFSAQGGYGTAQTFVDGTQPALWVGSAAVAVAGVAALLIPGRRRAAEAGEESTGTAPERVLETASR